MGYLGLVLFIGIIVGLVLNPFVQTPLNPAKEITSTTTIIDTSTITLPPITSTSTATSTTTHTTTTTSTSSLTTTIISTTITTTTTLIDTETWERGGIRIKQPQNVVEANFDVVSDEKDGAAMWLFNDYNRQLVIIWNQAFAPQHNDVFEMMRNAEGVNNTEIIDRGQITIDNHIWEYEFVSNMDAVGVQHYMVNAVGFYEEKSMSYWILFDTPNPNALNEMMTYTDTFKVL